MHFHLISSLLRFYLLRLPSLIICPQQGTTRAQKPHQANRRGSKETWSPLLQHGTPEIYFQCISNKAMVKY